MAYKIQHLGLGGVLDQAIAITKNHFGLLFGIMLFLVIPFRLIMGIVQLSMAPKLPADATSVEVIAAQQERSQYWPFYIGIAFIGGLIVGPVTNAAVIHAVARKYLGQDISAGESIKRGFAVLLPLIGTSILMGLAIMGGLILLIIPGILCALWFGLAQHVVVIEGISGGAALKRSKQLVRPYMGTFLILYIVLLAIVFALAFVGQLVPQIHVRLVVSVILDAITTILFTAAFVVFYFSCRCGVENFDLQYLAESIGAPAPEEDSPQATYGV